MWEAHTLTLAMRLLLCTGLSWGTLRCFSCTINLIFYSYRWTLCGAFISFLKKTFLSSGWFNLGWHGWWPCLTDLVWYAFLNGTRRNDFTYSLAMTLTFPNNTMEYTLCRWFSSTLLVYHSLVEALRKALICLQAMTHSCSSCLTKRTLFCRSRTTNPIYYFYLEIWGIALIWFPAMTSAFGSFLSWGNIFYWLCRNNPTYDSWNETALKLVIGVLATICLLSYV